MVVCVFRVRKTCFMYVILFKCLWCKITRMGFVKSKKITSIFEAITTQYSRLEKSDRDEKKKIEK